ncbi:MAG TPA: 2-dehydropantoate 2-reductase [Solirubrobacteraceae bacterium]|nr:2-dehydropantoate 2-reductase [Solirubrobacteraceae bacterium]
MRFVVFGAGAVGGVVGARLHQAGHDVALIARGAHLQELQRSGLTLETPSERTTLRIPTAGDPAELGVGTSGTDDVILLATKSQDTAGALDALQSAGAWDVPIVCMQNGVENERLALRRFRSVYGAVIMAPTAHLRPGAVEAYGALASGMIDLGRYPEGSDEVAEQVAAALSESQFRSRVWPDVMRLKYAKLILNLSNAVNALVAADDRRDELVARVIDEGRAALDAAGIEHRDDGVDDLAGRWAEIGVSDIDGRERAGSSTWQSLARGTGAVETDYLNGEIVLVGRLHDVPTPVNAAVCRLAAEQARGGAAPGELSVDDILAVAA